MKTICGDVTLADRNFTMNIVNLLYCCFVGRFAFPLVSTTRSAVGEVEIVKEFVMFIREKFFVNYHL